MSFSEDLKKAKSAEVPHQDVQVMVGGTSYTLRFRQMNAFEWASEVDRHPARGDTIDFDVSYGFNIRTLTQAVAPRTGVLVEGDVEKPLVQDETTDEWSELLDAISGHDFQAISDAVFYLNYMAPQRALIEAASAAKKGRPRSSRGSASQ
jgi:hypothetical protein